MEALKYEISLLEKEVKKLEDEIKEIEYILNISAFDVLDAKNLAFEALKKNATNKDLLYKKFEKLNFDYGRNIYENESLRAKLRNLRTQFLRAADLLQSKQYLSNENAKF